MTIFSVLLVLAEIGIILTVFVLSILTFRKVNKINILGECEGVPEFSFNTTFAKSITIPLINKTISGSVDFKSDNTFVLDFGSDSYTEDNKWIYDKNNCQLNIVLNPDLLQTIAKYNCSIDTEVKINRKGQLIVTGSILGILPIQVALNQV